MTYDGFELNISCMPAPDCNSISELEVSHVGGSSVLLSWSLSSGNTGGDPAYYQVTVNGVTDTTTQNPYWLTGLLPGTIYNVTVQGVCSTMETSFSRSAIFKTNCFTGGDIEIGVGSGSNIYYPTNVQVAYSYTQEIYFSSQLAGPATYTGMAYYANGSLSTRNISLYMGETTQSSFASVSDFVPDSLMHLVYTGPISTSGSGWFDILFDSTFTYTGLGNLVIAMDDNTGTTASAPGFRTRSGSWQALHYHNGSNINPANPSGSTQLNTTVQNDIKLYSACDTIATCVAPNVAAFYTTPTEAFLSWAPGLNETMLNVSHRASGSSTWITDTVGYNLTTYLVTGLIPNTEYIFRVTGICSDTTLDGHEIAWTQCSPVTTLPLVEDFESAPTGTSTTGTVFVRCWHHLHNGTS